MGSSFVSYAEPRAADLAVALVLPVGAGELAVEPQREHAGAGIAIHGRDRDVVAQAAHREGVDVLVRHRRADRRRQIGVVLEDGERRRAHLERRDAVVVDLVARPDRLREQREVVGHIEREVRVDLVALLFWLQHEQQIRIERAWIAARHLARAHERAVRERARIAVRIEGRAAQQVLVMRPPFAAIDEKPSYTTSCLGLRRRGRIRRRDVRIGDRHLAVVEPRAIGVFSERRRCGNRARLRRCAGDCRRRRHPRSDRPCGSRCRRRWKDHPARSP